MPLRHIDCIRCKPIFSRLHHDQTVFKFQGVATDYTYGSSAECVATLPPNSQKWKSGSVNEKKKKTLFWELSVWRKEERVWLNQNIDLRDFFSLHKHLITGLSARLFITREPMTSFKVFWKAAKPAGVKRRQRVSVDKWSDLNLLIVRLTVCC